MGLVPNWVDLTNGLALGGNDFSASMVESFVQVGTILYGIGYAELAGGSSPYYLYKSVDGGVSWTIFNTSWPWSDVGFDGNYIRTNNKLLYANGKLIFTIEPGSSLNTPTAISGNFVRWELDIASNSWNSVEDCGFCSGYVYATYESFFSCMRPDGTQILVHQTPSYGTNPDGSGYSVDVRKRASGGGWTLLTTIGDFNTDWTQLFQGVMRANGDIHLFLGTSPIDTNTFWGQWALNHASIEYATDAVSVLHLIDSDVESVTGGGTEGWWVPTPIGPPDIQGMGIAICYCSHEMDNGGGDDYPSPVPPSNVMVARGDLSSDPLNPSWAVDTVSTIGPPATQYDRSQCALSFSGNTVGVIVDAQDQGSGLHNTGFASATSAGLLKAYFISRYPNTNGDNPDATSNQLWSSSWSGTAWSAPAIEYTPAAGLSLFYFSLLNQQGTPPPPSGSYIRQLPRKGTQHSFMLA